jgi:hypothetical protein
MSIWDAYKRISGGNMINSFLHPEDAYKEAQKSANKGYGEAQGYQQPIINQGQAQYDPLNAAREKLMNPGALQNEWASQYETSPYAKQLLEQNQSAGLDAASSMGLNGSSAALGNIQTGAGNIQKEDRQQFLNDIMKKYMAGIGLGEDIYGAGANAASGSANRAFEHGNNIAGLKGSEVAAPGQLFGKLLGTAGNVGLNYATGGLSGAAGATNNMMTPNPVVNPGIGRNSMNAFNQG